MGHSERCQRIRGQEKKSKVKGTGRKCRRWGRRFQQLLEQRAPVQESTILRKSRSTQRTVRVTSEGQRIRQENNEKRKMQQDKEGMRKEETLQ